MASVSSSESRRWPRPGLGGQQRPWGPGLGRAVWQEALVPHETVSKSEVVATVERRGPTTPTGPGMRKEPRECHGPGAQTLLIFWPQFNPSPSLPGLPAHPPRGPAPGVEPTLPAKTGGPCDPPAPGSASEANISEAFPRAVLRPAHPGSLPPERLPGLWPTLLLAGP